MFCTLPAFSYGENRYSYSLSRMEREWLKTEFNEEDDEKRISRLEEKIFGTIHDIDIKTRYARLRRAFDAEKTIRKKNKYHSLSGFPTSTPISFDDFTN